jgi:ribosomal protein L28
MSPGTVFIQPPFNQKCTCTSLEEETGFTVWLVTQTLKIKKRGKDIDIRNIE